MDPTTATTNNQSSTPNGVSFPSQTPDMSAFAAPSSIDDTPSPVAGETQQLQTSAAIGTSSPGTEPETVTTTASSGSGSGASRRRIIMVGIVLVLAVAGIATGTFLLSRPQVDQSFAWDCTLYRFEVDQSGSVTALNGSVRDLPAQQVDIYINGELSITFDVPALNSGDSSVLGVVPVPENGSFTWRAIGNKDCDQTGSFGPEASAQCTQVKAFTVDWEPLTAAELSAMQAGELVRFTVGGTTSRGSFSAARFTINGELMEEVTTKRPGTDEFYYEYEIPEDVIDFTIDAEIMHSEAGWI